MAPAQDDYSLVTTGFDDQSSILAQWMHIHALAEGFNLERVLYNVASVTVGDGSFGKIEAVRRFFYHLEDVCPLHSPDGLKADSVARAEYPVGHTRQKPEPSTAIPSTTTLGTTVARNRK